MEFLSKDEVFSEGRSKLYNIMENPKVLGNSFLLLRKDTFEADDDGYNAFSYSVIEACGCMMVNGATFFIVEDFLFTDEEHYDTELCDLKVVNEEGISNYSRHISAFIESMTDWLRSQGIVV